MGNQDKVVAYISTVNKAQKKYTTFSPQNKEQKICYLLR